MSDAKRPSTRRRRRDAAHENEAERETLRATDNTYRHQTRTALFTRQTGVELAARHEDETRQLTAVRVAVAERDCRPDVALRAEGASQVALAERRCRGSCRARKGRTVILLLDTCTRAHLSQRPVEDERQKRAHRDTHRQSHLADGDVDGARVESQRGAKAQDFDKASKAAKMTMRQLDVDASSASRGRQTVSNSQRRKNSRRRDRRETGRRMRRQGVAGVVS